MDQPIQNLAAPLQSNVWPKNGGAGDNGCGRMVRRLYDWELSMLSVHSCPPSSYISNRGLEVAWIGSWSCSIDCAIEVPKCNSDANWYKRTGHEIFLNCVRNANSTLKVALQWAHVNRPGRTSRCGLKSNSFDQPNWWFVRKWMTTIFLPMVSWQNGQMNVVMGSGIGSVSGIGIDWCAYWTCCCNSCALKKLIWQFLHLCKQGIILFGLAGIWETFAGRGPGWGGCITDSGKAVVHRRFWIGMTGKWSGRMVWPTKMDNCGRTAHWWDSIFCDSCWQRGQVPAQLPKRSANRHVVLCSGGQ